MTEISLIVALNNLTSPHPYKISFKKKLFNSLKLLGYFPLENEYFQPIR